MEKPLEKQKTHAYDSIVLTENPSPNEMIGLFFKKNTSYWKT